MVLILMLAHLVSLLTGQPLRGAACHSRQSGLPSPGKSGKLHAKAERTCSRGKVAMQKFIIERDIPDVGSLERAQLKESGGQVQRGARPTGPDIQWVESYVADDKTFCVYLAKDKALIRRHAELSGFQANKITRSSKTNRSDYGHLIATPAAARCQPHRTAPCAPIQHFGRKESRVIAAPSGAGGGASRA